MSDLISKMALLEALRSIEKYAPIILECSKNSLGDYFYDTDIIDLINSAPAVSGEAVGIFIGEFHGDVNGCQYFTCKAIGALPKVGAELYLAPPQPQSVKDALISAADMCEGMALYTGVDCADEIRKLIEDN